MKFTSFSRQSSLIKQRLTKIHDSITTIFSTTTDITPEQQSQVFSYLGEVEKKQEDFQKILEKILDTDGKDYDEDKVFEFDQEISELCVIIRSSTHSISPVAKPRASMSSDCATTAYTSNSDVNVGHTSAIKLPPLVLKTFDGSPNQWLAFSSLFEATVHTNERISKIERFQYLLSSLQGPALQLVQNLPLTPDNYDVAWAILQQRYHNDRKILSHHINSIIDLPNVTNSSVKNLRTFTSTFEEHTQALKALKLDVAKDNPFLATILLRKVDNDLRRKFEDSRDNSKSLPDVREFITFLDNECVHMEAANLSQGTKYTNNNAQSNYYSKPSSMYHTKQSIPKTQNHRAVMLTSSNVKSKAHGCLHCKSTDHNIYRCAQFKELTPAERLQFVQKNRYCTNCLSAVHRSKDCKSEHVCGYCQNRHHSMLHLTQNESHAKDQTPSEEPQRSDRPVPTASTHNEVLLTSDSADDPIACVSTKHNKITTILLGTSLVRLTSPNGQNLIVRAVVDSASMVSCVTERCAQLLHLERSYATKSSVDGLSSQPVKTKGTIRLNITSLNGEEVATDYPVLVLDKITSHLPQVKVPHEIKDRFAHLTLADPTFNIPSKVDLLIDAGLFAKIMKGDRVEIGPGLPVAMSSVLGYLIIGAAPAIQPQDSAQCEIVTLLSTADVDLHNSIQKFWEMEEPPHSIKAPADEEFCENFFRSTVTRNGSGSYVVRLPVKENHPPLGDSYGVAKKRFFSLEKQFNFKPTLKEKYKDAIHDYLDSRHMEACPEAPTEELKTSRQYFLPHLPVIKEESSTTKLRVVFDASARTQNGVSLNDILYSGPKLQNSIVDVLVQFRRYPIVFTTDIKQMFRQIWVHPEDRNLLQLLWRDHANIPLQTQRLTTVTFGLSCSPFLALRTIQKLVEDAGEKFPLAANALNSQIYVDDIFLGANDTKSALELQTQLIGLMQEGGFQLRKWVSNSPELINQIQEDHRETPQSESNSEPIFKVLGLKWLSESDNFAFNFTDSWKTASTPTKRVVLSTLSQIFDPCGWLSPITFWAKAFVQQLWTLGLSWDEPLPPDLADKWLDFVNQLPLANDIRFPRYLDLATATEIQICGFCDASNSGFAGVVYVRCVTKSSIKVHLIVAKSKVAPLKRVSIPRLELCGAHLLAKLLDYSAKLLTPYYNITVRAWCDSTVALAWIKTAPYRLKTYIANRVAQIQDWVPPHLWSHVSTHQNPADCASRGLKSAELKSHDLWLNGPPWLSEPLDLWVNSCVPPVRYEDLPEIKTEPLSVLISQTPPIEWNLLSKFSSWSKLLRVLSYMIRFITKLKKKKTDESFLKTHELDRASRTICKHLQHTYFQEDLKQLRNDQPCSTRIQRLSPFLDKFGLIRVGGRLKHSDLPYSVKYPILLPKSHHVTNLIIDYYHLKYLHCGPQLLQSLISQKYWILSARSIIRTRVFRCQRCFRCKPRNSPPLMGDLPASRITPARPFSRSGCDYAGPITIKMHLNRRVQESKVYLCVFVCFVTKAVHIEVATDLTTEAFIAALTRFTARRGLCNDIYSDCGTNFVGAANQLQKLQEFLKEEDTRRSIQHFASENSINFHFNPPAAPHQGGLWESAVKSAKHHLLRVIGDYKLTLEELITLTTRIESILNSRPITVNSTDPSEPTALTPGHFLIGGPLVTLPERQVEELPLNRLRRWQVVQALTQRLWKRWTLEYLHSLQERTKWIEKNRSLEPEDVVVIHDPDTPPLQWKIGRVTQVFPGKDDVVRVVDVKTAKGLLRRPATKVFKLPID